MGDFNNQAPIPPPPKDSRALAIPARGEPSACHANHVTVQYCTVHTHTHAHRAASYCNYLCEVFPLAVINTANEFYAHSLVVVFFKQPNVHMRSKQSDTPVFHLSLNIKPLKHLQCCEKVFASILISSVFV